MSSMSSVPHCQRVEVTILGSELDVKCLAEDARTLTHLTSPASSLNSQVFPNSAAPLTHMQRPKFVVSADDSHTSSISKMKIPWNDGRPAEIYYPQFEGWEAVRAAMVGTGGLVRLSVGSEAEGGDERIAQGSVWRGQENGRFYMVSGGEMTEMRPREVPADVGSGSVSRPTALELETVLKTLTTELTKLKCGSDHRKPLKLEFAFNLPAEPLGPSSSDASAERGMFKLTSLFGSRRDTPSSRDDNHGGGSSALGRVRRIDESRQERRRSLGGRAMSGSGSAQGSSAGSGVIGSTDTGHSGDKKTGRHDEDGVMRIWVPLPDVLQRNRDIAEPRFTR